MKMKSGTLFTIVLIIQRGSQIHQGQKPGKTAPGGGVLGLTRGKNPTKLPLVIIFKEQMFCQKLHIEHLMKSSIAQSDAPGAKTQQNCPWWACFKPDQGQKPRKTAPGHNL